MNNKGRFQKGHIPHNKISLKATCIICGKIFPTLPYHIRKGHAKYCSMKCYGQSKIGQTKAIPLLISCVVCGNKFRTYPSRIKRNRSKYCSQKCFGIARKGKITRNKNFNWNGGKKIVHSYLFILKPDHPFVTKSGYVRKHRLVMEKHLGRYLKPTEVIHHINGDTLDNRIDNLMLFPSNSAHMSFHCQLRKVN
jgi:hypothetical protein